MKSIGRPMIVVLNMMDMAQRRGIKINTNIIAKELGCAVIPMIATKGDGVAALMTRIDQMLPANAAPAKPVQSEWSKANVEGVAARFACVDEILAKAIEAAGKSDRLTWKIDRVALHPVWGSLILCAVLILLFQTVFTWAKPFADSIDTGVQWIQHFRKVP